MKTPLLLLLLLVFARLAFSADFSKGDAITLTRDEPLYFKDSVYRQGSKGETFTVYSHNAATHKIFVLTKDEKGKPIGLNINEDALGTKPATRPAQTPKPSMVQERMREYQNPLNNHANAKTVSTDGLPWHRQDAATRLREQTGKREQGSAQRAKAFREEMRHRDLIGDAGEEPEIDADGDVPAALAYYQRTLKDYSSAKLYCLGKPALYTNSTREHRYWVVSVSVNAKNSYGTYIGATTEYVLIQNGKAIDAVSSDSLSHDYRAVE